MSKLGFLIIFLTVAPFAFAQLDSHTITVTASRSIAAQDDQVEIDVSATAPATKTLSDVIAAVGSLGITATNLTSVSSSSSPGVGPAKVQFMWTFATFVPFSAETKTVAQIGIIQQSIFAASGISLSYYVAGAQTSQPIQPCPYVQLVNDARSQAQQLAAAAGLTVGNLLALSDAVTSTPVMPYVIYDFVTISGIVSPTPPPQSCTLTVKFQLLGS